MHRPAISDETVTSVLGVDVGLVHRVLNVPQRRLGLDDDLPPGAPVPPRVLDRSSIHGHVGAGARRAAGTVWQPAIGLLGVSSMLDECGAIRRASRRTSKLVGR